jgi:hypothetical protein
VRRYNVFVPAADPNHLRQRSPQNDTAHDADKHRRQAVYASETIGLLLIAAFLLILTLIRYWHYIHWSLR